MLFGYITLAVAFLLSMVAAYYSVLGLVAIFSAAVIPVMIMGGALETGKVVAAMWLHRNWHRAPWTYKAYLLPSLLALMLLTSMGTFGYLSKAHSDQSLVSGDVTSKIALYDEKIRISRENIDANRAALKQLDAAVDQIMGRSTTEQGAERSVQIRRQQAPERQRLIREIEAEQKKISELNEARAPIAAEVRKVEAEVGPIKYIAALIYGDNPENNLLESAVRWVIILIVVVFDPLAIVLILAGSKHLEWERASKTSQTQSKIEQKPESLVADTAKPLPLPVINHAYLTRPGTWFKWRPMAPKVDRHRYLNLPGTWFKWKPFDTAKPQEHSSIPITTPEPDLTNIDHTVDLKPDTVPVARGLTESDIELIKSRLSEEDPIPKYTKIDRDYVRIGGKVLHRRVLAENGYTNVLEDMDNPESDLAVRKHHASFGKSFPERPEKGDMHVHVGTLPSKLYKFNGQTWMEVDKNTSSSYTHNQAYIRYLVEKLESREITIDDLTEHESTMIFDYLKNAQSTNYTA